MLAVGMLVVGLYSLVHTATQCLRQLDHSGHAAAGCVTTDANHNPLVVRVGVGSPATDQLVARANGTSVDFTTRDPFVSVQHR